MEPVEKRSKLDMSDVTRKKLDAVLQPITLSDDAVRNIIDIFSKHMELANNPDENTRKKSDLLMGNSFIRDLLDGTEQGEFLGLDLGGTNFRVVRVSFKDGEADTTTQYYTLLESVLCGPVAGVFDFIAESIQDFVNRHGLAKSDEKIPLGFTFSFPSLQVSLNQSVILHWTKTLRCPDGIGDDPVALLEAAIARKAKDLPVKIVAVMSDTVSTLMAGNYLDKKCRIGLILGTGCNAAFVEHISEIDKWTGDDKNPQHVIVNVELGSFGDSGCLDHHRTDYERELDKFSNHPSSFTFEKSCAGMYLGEFVRLVLVKLIQEGVLFGGKGGKLVEERWKFTTSHVTAIESDQGLSTANTMEVLNKFDLDTVATAEDIAVVREVAEVGSRRGAHWIAILMVALVNRVALPEVTIAIDGSLFERHPKYHNSMMEILDKFCPSSKVKLILAKDGSGQGGAFGAVSALRQAARGIRSA
ncbi:phosphotransferase [Plakobranchus ocellatus]|uniref:Phosphotransferase n=1 Tax=Plakobranchus ocellatus TaxID=259542 RepID=A0AAV3YTL0_9GAST|nr:phosphotransferase [Plakobranchus ocellatus]